MKLILNIDQINVKTLGLIRQTMANSGTKETIQNPNVPNVPSIMQPLRNAMTHPRPLPVKHLIHAKIRNNGEAVQIKSRRIRSGTKPTGIRNPRTPTRIKQVRLTPYVHRMIN